LRIAICADDYALTPRISSAILDLARAGRISAVSCMTASPLWPELGLALKPLADKVDVGLHLTLVEETPLTPMPRTLRDGRLPSVGRLIAQSYLGQVPREEISDEVDAQIAAFTAVMERPPAHIDGHLHAHVLPGIREIVLAAAERMTPRPWLRTITDRAVWSRPAGFKAAVLNLLGKPFTREARARGFATNDGFSGFYDFTAGSYTDLFPAFLRAAGPRHLILCHPGDQNDEAAALAKARGREYAFLNSAAFAAVLPPENIVRISAITAAAARP
jgi:predicted glycoside hydrolase/deacetylase ChbG (UPF0249 family)